MAPRAELFIILLLGSTLITVSLPFYASLGRTPEEVFFGEGVYIMSQASPGSPLDYGLVDELRTQEWTIAVSPEVYSFIGVGREAIVIRGVEPEAFSTLEGIALPGNLREEFLLMGERLAARMEVQQGDTILLPGSLRPLLLEATVDGILSAQGGPGDEILLDLARARYLAGLGGESIILVRVKVEDGGKLLEYLASSDAALIVGGQGINLRVEEGTVFDDRIGALILTRPELARELGRSYIGSFAQYSGDSLRVLVLGMAILTGVLFLLILTSSLVRFLVEIRRDVGLVVALGGGFGALFSAYGRKLLRLGLLAGLAGHILGIGMGGLLEAAGTFTFFGHTLRYTAGLWQSLETLSLYATILLSAILLSLIFLLRQQPRDLLYEVPERKLVKGEVGGD